MTDIWLLKPLSWAWSVLRNIFNKWTIVTLLVVTLFAMTIDELRALIVSGIKYMYVVLAHIDWFGVWGAIYGFLQWLYPFILSVVAAGKANPFAVYILIGTTILVMLGQALILALLKFTPGAIRIAQRKAAWFGIRHGLWALALGTIIVMPLVFLDPGIAVAVKSALIIVNEKAYGSLKKLVEQWLWSGKFEIKQLSEIAKEIESEG